jgi:hypothetical protein
MVDFADPPDVAREATEAEQPLESARAGYAIGEVLNSIAMVDILRALFSAPYYEYSPADLSFEWCRQPDQNLFDLPWRAN